MLERTLRSYSCLTVGDCFVVNYNNKKYELEVKDAKPKPAISIIECDCEVRRAASGIRAQLCVEDARNTRACSRLCLHLLLLWTNTARP